MKACVFSLVLLALATANARPQSRDGDPAPRPNILFVFTDDHAPHAISAYGSRINKTPNIDRLATEGMIFDRSYCGNSICGPSRATILTGKHSHNNGFIDNRSSFDGSQVTFPKLLRAAGYQTAIIGKWHLRSDPTGFDHWEVLNGQGPYWNPPLKTAAGTTRYEGYTTDVLTDHTLTWLDEGRDRSKPFLLMFQHKAPHRDWQPGPKHYHLYDDMKIEEPATLFDDWKNRTSAAAKQTMTIANHMSERDLKFRPPGGLTPAQLQAWHAAYDPKNEAFKKLSLTGKDLVRWRYQRYIKDYLRCIASVDDNLGRVLSYLDETGLADNTIVVYSSDQGFYLGDHGWYDKRWMYEESYRMPLVVRWPKVIKPGTRSQHLVQNIDYAQTFLDMAGVQAPDDMQGKSLVPIMNGEVKEWRTSLYYHYWEYPAVHSVRRHYGVSTTRYKLIHYYRLGEWELFDLDKDPSELKSVYDDPAYAETKRRLEVELERLREHYGDVDPDMTDPPRRSPRGPAPKNVKLKKVLDLKLRIDPRPKTLTCANRPLSVGARCAPASGDGVLVALGGAAYGWSLAMSKGMPRFSVRSAGELKEVIGPAPLEGTGPHVICGVLDKKARLHLWVNGEEVASAPGLFIARNPSDGLDVGQDSNSRVDGREGAGPFAGKLENIRVFDGVLPKRRIRRW